LSRTKRADPKRDEQTITEACAWHLELVLQTCERFAEEYKHQEATAGPSELTDAWYAQEMGSGVAWIRRMVKRVHGKRGALLSDVKALAFAAMELGAFMREFEANRHDIVKRGENSLKSSSAGGKNKQPICKRRSCQGAHLSLCGHPPWQEEVTAQFQAARRDNPSITKTGFATRFRKELELKLSAKTILNVLSSLSSGTSTK
jgi:hypothetical protein